MELEPVRVEIDRSKDELKLLAEHDPPMGTFRTEDGRKIYQMPLGIGPGGGKYGALLESHDERYEVIVTVFTNFHDDEDRSDCSECR